MRKNKIKRKISLNKYLIRKYFSKLILIGKIFFPVLLFLSFMYLIIFSNLFTIKNVNIIGDDVFVNTQDVMILADANLLGKNLFFIDTEKLIKDLNNNFLGAKDFVISKKFPNTINLTISERIPIAIVYKNTDNYYLVDDEGYILGYVDPNSRELPKIKYERDLDVGKFIDKDLVPLYNELTSYLQQEEVKASSISIYPNHVLFYLDPGPEVLIGKDKNKLESIKIINFIVRQALLDNKQIERIDLRYDKVIVLFK